MDERLKRLKKAMKNNTFQHVQFKEAQREKINESIEQIHTDLTPLILTLLTQRKTGSDLSLLLHARGIKSIVNNEGIIYTHLHTQEHLGYVKSYWEEDGEKYYELTNKGLNLIQKEQLQLKNRYSLKDLFQELNINEN